MRQPLRIIASMVLLFGAGGCSQPVHEPAPQTSSEASSTTPDAAPNSQVDWKPKQLDDVRLHNAYWLHDRVISGGLPEEPGMQALRELGVKTVISVDGARPDVELAKKHGMRYVHLPHGYDGIPEDRARELAKAVLELEGPIYIHCHHGKHRSPAAAATACIGAGLIPASRGLAVLKTAGTSEGYRSLYQTVTEMTPLDRAMLEQLQVEYRETVPVAPLAEAMVALEHTHDHLKLLAANSWQPVAAHPDIDPPHEALLLMEHFAELLRTDEVQRRPEAFQQILRDGQEAARKLEASLRTNPESSAASELTAARQTLLNGITRGCQNCHQQFRDTPLREKAAAGNRARTGLVAELVNNGTGFGDSRSSRQ